MVLRRIALHNGGYFWPRIDRPAGRYCSSQYHSLSVLSSKRQKVSSTASYDRWAVYADLANPPHCFCMLTTNPTDSLALFKDASGQVAIGTIFYIVEPSKCIGSVQGNLPIIQTCKTLVPLKLCYIFLVKFRILNRSVLAYRNGTIISEN